MKPASLAKWPSSLPEQIAAVQRALAQGERSWPAEEVARGFKSAKRAAVVEVLESLASRGRLVAFEANGEKRGKAPARAAT